MENYQEIVEYYLRADRSLFLNAECMLQIQEGRIPPKGSSLVCDAVAADFRTRTIFLCEVSYASNQQSQIKRLKEWHHHWQEIRDSLRDVEHSNLPADWPVRPWIFVPEEYVPLLLKGLDSIRDGQQLSFVPRITTLEMVQPWRYCTYDRKGERLELKPDCIPIEMQS